MGGISKKEDYITSRLFRDLWIFLEGRRMQFLFYTSLILLASAMSYILLYFLGKIVDFFISYNKGDPLSQFYLFIFIIAITGSLDILFRSAGKLNIVRIGGEIRQKVKNMAMAHLINLELAWHEKESTGSKVQKIQSGSYKVYQAFWFIANDGLSILSSLGATLFIFIFLNIKYALFGLIFSLIYISAELYFRRHIKDLELRMNRASERLSGKIHESASNILAVKALGIGSNVKRMVQRHESTYYNVWLEGKRKSHMRTRFVKVFAALGYAAFILLLGFDVSHGFLQAATVFVVAGYFSKLSGSMDIISGSLSTMVDIQVGIGRLMGLLDEKIISREGSDLRKIDDDWRHLEIKRVDFKYKEEPVLKNFSLLISRGEKVGIVGRSGSGKSTLSKIILGLYPLNSGEVTFDGVSLENIKQSSISKRISIVLQDSEMFNMSLEDNVMISGEENSKRLSWAAKVANLEPVIKNLPKGLKTIIGEKGYKLSGGERQRVGIARAVYRNSDILILDEATSHLDSKTEKIIQENLERELHGKTMIIIAHRLSTLKNVDRIIVMDKGKIVEEGKFDELIKKRGLFSQIYKIQQHQKKGYL